jgi:hypothetical protein
MTYGTRIRWSKDGSQLYTSAVNVAPGKTRDLASPLFLDGIADTANIVSGGYVLINLPTPVKLARLGIRWGATTVNGVTIDVSSNSADGFSGDWITIYGPGPISAVTASPVEIYAGNGETVKWLRISGTIHGIRNIHIFGEYQAPSFELWDETGLAELDTDYPLNFGTALKSQNYSHIETFRVKNLDTIAHTYTLTVQAIKYGGESFITDNFKLSTDAGATRATSVFVTVASGALSGVISVCADVPSASNPADGPHYFCVFCTHD